MRHLAWFLFLLVAGCASRPAPVIVATPAPVAAPVATIAPPLPPGATPGMRIPAALADGSYPTPNRALTPAATIWHLRAGLNVAALACQGQRGLDVIAAYNAMLGRYKAVLAAAEASYAAEYRAGGGDWRDRYDDEMTRLYNYFSQTPARDGLCAAASDILAQSAAVPADGLPAFAGAEIARLDRPFTDFYRAYDAWRNGAVPRIAAAPPPVIALAANSAQALPRVPQPVTPPTSPSAPSHPILTIDPSVFGTPEPNR